MSSTINIIILLFQLLIIVKSIKYFKFSPVYIYVLFSIISLTLSVLYFYFYEKKFSLYNLDFITEKDFLNIVDYYLLSINAFLLGVIFFYNLSINNTRSLFNHNIETNFVISFNIKNKDKNSIIIYFIILFCLFFWVYGKSLFFREDYASFDEKKGFVIIVSLLSFIGCVLAAILYRQYKSVSISLFLILMVFYFGTGSRICFILLLLYGIIAYFSTVQRGLLKKVKLLFLVIFSFFFLAYLIQIRSLPDHGIIPYSAYLLNMNFELIEKVLFNVYYILIFGYFVSIGTVKMAVYDWSIIFINLNPLPGSLAGWYDYAETRRINIYAPFSTHGEAFRMGKTFTFFFFFCIGLVFTYFDKQVRNMFMKGHYFKSIILVIILCLHIFYAFEYNMRASVRYIYYALFYLLVLFSVRSFIKLLKVKTK